MTHTVILDNPRAREKARFIVDAAPWGHVVTVKAPTRSVEQNAKMWAMLSDLSIAKPEGLMMTPDLWKAACMSACGHEVQFAHGLDGSPPFPAGFASSKLDKYQMMELIEFILAYGARHGVQWSNEVPKNDEQP